ncbi:MAG: hypothetical protein KDA05_08205 [Phycisphaerales bacterium]|nr:hypothetical protein [Phycisphaerales bacterium]
MKAHKTAWRAVLNGGVPGAAAACAAAAMVVATTSLPSVGVSMASATPMAMSLAFDKIVLRDGRVLEGTIVEETGDSVGIKLVIAGIEAQTVTTFSMRDVLRIDRAEAGDTPSETTATAPRNPHDLLNSGNQQRPADPGATRVYRLRLTGEFGTDITQTPIRQAIEDAARQQAQIIVVEVDNEWQASRFQEKAEDENSFDEFWRANDIVPVFRNEIPNLFPYERPRLVVWVKNAMGGAAFLPFMSREIYFSSGGRMGGIGDLDTYFQGVDEWVKDKQQSLRLAAARGIAIAGGYDSRLIDAMTMREYVLSVGFPSGQPEYYVGYPRPEHNETLLTDDGDGDNEDTDADVVRAQGNDNLTLHAEMAQRLNVSKGTVDSFDDLLYAIDPGLARNHVIVSDRADRIMDDWATGVDDAIRTFQRMWQQELPQAQGREQGGEWAQRNRARGEQRAIIERLIRLISRYKEVLDPQGGTLAQLQLQLEAIRLRSIADRRP